jgi:UDP-3-O-[3-hydroxymyristoyl] glucosamine N-acyltransferase
MMYNNGHNTAVIKTDGTLWAWGTNHTGAFANGTTTLVRRSTPVQLLSSISDWTSVSVIDSTANISPSAIVSKTNVIIESGVVIEEYCVIAEHTTIESDTIVRSGCIVGSTALYIGKGFEGERLSAKHFGATKIGRGTELGPNSVIDRGMFAHDVTKVDCENFIGPLCNISHSVNIGPRNFIAAGVLISGYTSMESDNWIGPGVTISHKIKIGSRNYISLGSSLLRSIQHDTKVIGGRIFENEFPVRR